MTTTVGIYHCSDGKPWADYLAGHLKDESLKLKISTCDVNKKDDLSVSVRVLLVSPDFLEYLRKSPDKCASKDNFGATVAVLCSVQATELRHLSTRSEWTIVTLTSSEQGVRKLIETIIKTIDAYEEAVFVSSGLSDKEKTKEPVRNQSGISDNRVAPKPAPRKRPVETAKSEPSPEATLAIPKRSRCPIQGVFPTKITHLDDSICIVFGGNKSPEGDIEVEINNKKIVAKRLNPFTFEVKPPGGVRGKVLMEIYEKKVKINSYQLQFEYVDTHALSYNTFLAESLGIPVEDRDALDHKLLELFNRSVPSDESCKLFSQLSNDYQNTTERSKSYLPTLLHFAAVNGYRDLTCRLMDLSGSLLAYQIENCHGQDPASLAEHSGYTDLAEYIRNYVETKIGVDMVDDIYVTINKHALLYENTLPRTGGSSQSIYSTANGSGDDDSDISEDVFMGGLPTKLVSEKLPRKRDKRAKSSSEQKSPPKETPFPKSATLPNKSTYVFGFDKPTAGSVGSKGQEELKLIQKMCAQGLFSVDNAQKLFHAWNMRYAESSTSFKDRQKTLQKLRETFKQTLQTAEESKKKSSMGKLLNRVRTTRKNHYGKAPGLSGQTLNISLPLSRLDSETQQHSGNDYSAERWSGGSACSSSSGNFSNEEHFGADEGPTELGASSNRGINRPCGRTSRRLNVLKGWKLEERSAPPIPPRARSNAYQSPPLPPK